MANSHVKPVNATSNERSAAISQSYDAEKPRDEGAAGSINAADEVTRIKLALIVIGLCFSNILTGLPSLMAISDGVY